MIGHITIDRKILAWEWYTDSNMVHLFLHLLLKASHKDIKIKGISIKRGQLISGRLKLAKDVGLTEMQIRTCLNKLKSTNEISIKVTNKYSIITVCKYDSYQNKKEHSNQQNNQQFIQQTTNKQPTSNQQVTTYNNDNNIKNDKNENIKEKKNFSDLENVEEKNISNRQIENTERMIVTEMMKVWNKHNPKSLIDIEKDYSACLEIAHKIAQVKGWKKTDVINLKELDVVQSWERIMIFIKSDNFLKKLPLANLNNNFQMVVQNMVAANEENNTSLRVQKVQPMTEKEKQKAMEEWANSD